TVRSAVLAGPLPGSKDSVKQGRDGLSAKAVAATLPATSVKPLLAALAVLVVACPAGASIGAQRPGPTMTVVDVPLRGQRSLSAARPPERFDLVGLHWQGDGSVGFRTHRAGGGWSAWRGAAPEADD